MSIPQSAEELPLDKGRRRSLRVMLSVTAVVRGKNAEGNAFEEETKTLVVNAHGALIHLRADVKAGQKITLFHKGTQEAQQSRIVYVGTTMHGGKGSSGNRIRQGRAEILADQLPPEDWNGPED
jgi:hypothetical protein